MCEQVRLAGLARFADMDHVTGPLRVAFASVTGIDIVGRFDALGGPWQFAVFLEAHLARGWFTRSRHLPVGPFVVALPGAAQGVDDR